MITSINSRVGSGRNRWGRAALLAMLACALQLGSSGVRASIFTVNDVLDAVDINPGDGVCETAAGHCTLRAAVQEANAHAGLDSIVLQDNATYTFTRAGVEDAAASGDLDILESVDISVAGGGSAIIDGNRLGVGERVFQIFLCTANHSCDAGHPAIVVTMTGLTLQNGTAGDGGGGILNAGTLTLTNCIVTHSIGSGIVNFGTVTLTNSVISDNLTVATNAYGAGVMNFGVLSVLDSTISGNKTTDTNNTFGNPGFGGGIYSHGSAMVIRSTISGNTAVAAAESTMTPRRRH